MRSRSRPRPSSAISMLTWPPSWKARRRSTPSGALPASRRTSGGSMPWSTALRTTCVSGSLMASMIVRSSSVSAPSVSIRTRLPHACARSRTTRGSLLQTLSIGCMRAFMTCSCSSPVIRLSRWVAEVSAASSECAENCTIWLRASTSSPTRFISRSSRTTSTRTLLSLRSGTKRLPRRSREAAAVGARCSRDGASAVLGPFRDGPRAGFSRVVATASPPVPSRSSTSFAISSPKSSSPSTWSSSSRASTPRVASTTRRSASDTSRSSGRTRSRTRASRFSPACVSLSVLV